MIECVPNFRLGPFRKMTMWGTDKAYPYPYLTRVSIGWLSLHVFHRGDNDPDPHDHEEDFWTFPLVSYVEEVLENGRLLACVVRSFRVHHRAAEYTHRVVGPWDGTRISYDAHRWYDRASARRGAIFTIVWRAKQRRSWGFWVEDGDAPGRVFLPWRDYIFTDWRRRPARGAELAAPALLDRRGLQGAGPGGA